MISGAADSESAGRGLSNFHEVARLRANETQVLTQGGLLLGAVYLAGYVVECKLKHLLHLKGIRFPRGGSEGHNLRGLWLAAGFPAARGHAALFLDHWGTELRYETELPKGVDPHDLLAGGRELAQWVTTRIRQAGSNRFRSRGVR
ncbi:hypothetical protein [Streptomyces sp. 147326]|uniref:hypothetical protein n=1 Tax=Streptomyces sp. 147326 TaxID=3074379 RepID=UPI0038578BC1